MKSMLAKTCFLLIVLVAPAGAFYDAPSPTKLTGVINDFSPPTTNPAGPYLVNGHWTLQFQPSRAADFSASFTMVRSDDLDRNFHTHHVRMAAGQVTVTNTGGLLITGPAVITSGGNEVFPGSSVQIEITGGTVLPRTNLKLTFLGPVAFHFTSEPYDGVVDLP
jgi:hypothetical protein